MRRGSQRLGVLHITSIDRRVVIDPAVGDVETRVIARPVLEDLGGMTVYERHPRVLVERAADLGKCVGRENVVVVEFHEASPPCLGTRAVLGRADTADGVVDDHP